MIESVFLFKINTHAGPISKERLHSHCHVIPLYRIYLPGAIINLIGKLEAPGGLKVNQSDFPPS